MITTKTPTTAPASEDTNKEEVENSVAEVPSTEMKIYHLRYKIYLKQIIYSYFHFHKKFRYTQGGIHICNLQQELCR